MTIDHSRNKSSPADPTMTFVQSLLQRARTGIIKHDAKAIVTRLRALRSLRFPTQRPRTHSPARARRSPASLRRAAADSGGLTDPDPEPRRTPHTYSLPAMIGGA